MKVKDVMSTTVVTARADASFRELVELMLSHRISGIPIVGRDGALVGVVTEKDLLGKEAYAGARKQGLAGFFRDLFSNRDVWLDKADAFCARDLMSFPVVTAEPDELVRAAARTMIEEDVKRLPVVRNGAVVGIVSRSDLLRLYRRDDGALAAEIRELLHRCMYLPPDHDVTVQATDGVVTLSGRVQYASDVHVIEAIITSADGVVGVHNELWYTQPDPTTTG